jgi:hypothetical protein
MALTNDTTNNQRGFLEAVGTTIRASANCTCTLAESGAQVLNGINQILPEAVDLVPVVAGTLIVGTRIALTNAVRALIDDEVAVNIHSDDLKDPRKVENLYFNYKDEELKKKIAEKKAKETK